MRRRISERVTRARLAKPRPEPGPAATYGGAFHAHRDYRNANVASMGCPASGGDWFGTLCYVCYVTVCYEGGSPEDGVSAGCSMSAVTGVHRIFSWRSVDRFQPQGEVLLCF